MAPKTTPRKIALVVGPLTWGDSWRTRDDRRIPPRPPERREDRIVEAAEEERGLDQALAELPDDCAVLLATAGRGATRQAARWANAADRQTIVVPVVDTDPAVAPLLAVELAAALAVDPERRVKVLACTVDPDGDPVVADLRAWRLYVQPVLPIPAPEPVVTPPGEDTESAETATYPSAV